MPDPHIYFDRDGKPLPDMYAWSDLHEQTGYSRIGLAKIMVGGEVMVEVSTIWTGISADDQRLIFETAVFDGDGSVVDSLRSASLSEAREIHRGTVDAMAAGLVDSVVDHIVEPPASTDTRTGPEMPAADPNRRP